jgi:steroid 5-alpha reductase family enzyme
VAILAGLFVLHYLHRAVVYPLRRRRHASPIPLSVVAMAFAFNLVNGTLQGAWIGLVGTRYDAGWLADPRLLVGVALFLAGLAANVASDEVLLRLRRRSGGAYGVPRGGLFRWVSCPNYLGEIVEWAGWAIAAWSLPALAFAVWTAANLVPRALAHHRWYRDRFADYPPRRRALVPGVL